MRLSPTALKSARALVVLGVSLGYLVYVFHYFEWLPRSRGLGDWQDPYFINALLEHWYWSAVRLTDPTSPAMFFPAEKTLAYTHGLILYAPFYAALRIFLHPFQAYTLALCVVMELGILCLYVLLRRLGLSFIESLLLAALFFSSQNVVGGETGVWSQRASVFLIPPIILLLLISGRARPRPATLLLAGLAGLLSTLLYVQDFYTAHFAFLFLAIFAVGAAVARVPGTAVAAWVSAQPRASMFALAVAVLGAVWSFAVSITGGGELNVLGIRLRSHDPQPAALVALAALTVVLVSSGLARAGIRFLRAHSWLSAVGAGALIGALVFLWMYVGAYAEHGAFPEDHLLDSLTLRHPSRWRTPLDVIRDLGGYPSLRPFALAFIAGALAWIPWFRVDRTTCIHALWWAAVSMVVLLIPSRFADFSAWRVLFQPLPGFEVIRDPKRVVQVYELAIVLAMAILLARLRARSAMRRSIALLALVLLAADRNPDRFDYERHIAVFQRWVAAPIAIDPACRSFYVKRASDDYMTRSGHMWSLYAIDSMFVALEHGIPTLNGYSAWVPEGWDLGSPHEPDYPDRVRRWVERHGLTSVCELDIDARTMSMRFPQGQRQRATAGTLTTGDSPGWGTMR